MEKLKISEQLVAVRDLIKDPKHWIQGRNARTKKKFWFFRGKPVTSGDPEAYSWCLWGAILKTEADATVFLLDKILGESNMIRFNDTHSHEEVIALLDKAIKLAIQQEEVTPL